MEKIPKVYLMVGVPGAGKSWVCGRLVAETGIAYANHDMVVGRTGQSYAQEVLDLAFTFGRVLAEAPFSVSEILDLLRGVELVPVLIAPGVDVLRRQYLAREGREIPKQHVTRQQTYLRRAAVEGWFAGNSGEVLEHMRVLLRT